MMMSIVIIIINYSTIATVLVKSAFQDTHGLWTSHKLFHDWSQTSTSYVSYALLPLPETSVIVLQQHDNHATLTMFHEHKFTCTRKSHARSNGDMDARGTLAVILAGAVPPSRSLPANVALMDARQSSQSDLPAFFRPPADCQRCLSDHGDPSHAWDIPSILQC